MTVVVRPTSVYRAKRRQRSAPMWPIASKRCSRASTASAAAATARARSSSTVGAKLTPSRSPDAMAPPTPHHESGCNPMTIRARIRTAKPASPSAISGGKRKASPFQSRRSRKRHRRNIAEATARAPQLRGGWGQGSEIRASDLLLIRRAVREDWPVPQAESEALIGDVVLSAARADDKPRLQIAAVRVVIDVVKSHHGEFGRLRRRLAKQEASR